MAAIKTEVAAHIQTKKQGVHYQCIALIFTEKSQGTQFLLQNILK
jgi:hypothetical protein